MHSLVVAAFTFMLRNQTKGAIMNMKKRLIVAILLCLAICLTACAAFDKGNDIAAGTALESSGQGAGEPSGTNAQNLIEGTVKSAEDLAAGSYSAASIEIPEQLGRVYTITVYEDKLFAAGIIEETPTLYCIQLKDNNYTEYDIPEIDGFSAIEGLAASEGTLFLIVSHNTDGEIMYEIDVYDIASNSYTGSYPVEGLENAICKQWISVAGKLISSIEFGGVSVFSSEGKALFSIRTGAKFIADVDGHFIYLASLPGAKEQAIFELNLDTGKSTQLCKVEGDYDVSYISHYGVILANKVAAYSANLSSGETSHILDWRDSGAGFGLAPEGLQLLANGDFIAFDRLSGTIYRLSPSTTGQKEILTIGCGEGAYGPYLTQAVAEFNFSNKDCMARILEYSSNDVSRILAEISAGNGPDILFMGSSTDRENLFNRVIPDEGICVDLMPYIEADKDLSTEDFVHPVFSAMMSKDQMFELIPCFSVNSMVASSSLEDKIGGWNIHTAIDLNENLPEGYALFSVSDKQTLLDQLCMLASIRYVDKINASCSFEDGEFALWLELCKDAVLYSHEADLGYFIQPGTMSYMVPSIAQKAWGGDYSYMGMPVEDGAVNFFSSAVGGFSILQSSKNKDFAWEFLKILLSEDLQKSFSLFGYPVIQKSLEAQLVEDVNDENREYDAEDMNKFLAVVNTGRGMAKGSVISDIIREESQKFFSGQAELKSTVSAIQSRSSTFVVEQYG